MALIGSFPEAEPEGGDWLLVEKSNPSRYHKIALNKVGGSGGSANWVGRSAATNQAAPGEKILADNRTESWSLIFPGVPKPGEEIQVIPLSKSRALRLNFNGKPYRGVVDSNSRIIYASPTTKETFDRLIYVDDSTGWIDINSRVGILEDYYSLVTPLTRFAHYRMSHADSASITDVTGSNTAVGFGSYQLQQPSLLIADNNLSCQFTGTTSYIRINTNAIAGPNAYTIEMLIRTSISNGGLIGFANSATPGGSSFDRELRINNGFLQAYIFPGGTITSTIKINDNQPHIVTYSLGTFGQRIWCDGALVATGTGTGASAYSGWWKLGYSVGLNAYYQGIMDEVFVTHSSAVETEVVRRHQAALGIR